VLTDRPAAGGSTLQKPQDVHRRLDDCGHRCDEWLPLWPVTAIGSLLFEHPYHLPSRYQQRRRPVLLTSWSGGVVDNLLARVDEMANRRGLIAQRVRREALQPVMTKIKVSSSPRRVRKRTSPTPNPGYRHGFWCRHKATDHLAGLSRRTSRRRPRRSLSMALRCGAANRRART
jgi:hypothetical protein